MTQKNNLKNSTNIFNYPAKKYSSYVFDETIKYQKQYGFEMGTGPHGNTKMGQSRGEENGNSF